MRLEKKQNFKMEISKGKLRNLDFIGRGGQI